jgi:paraquat-inducible protein B
MPNRSHATAIGVFVIGAMAIVVAAIVTLGSGRLFRETATWVCYFDGSVEGLELGAPVKARGVSIGRVVRIQLRFRQRPQDIRVPVFLELDLKRVRGLTGERLTPERLRELVARGLRARLENQSLVTGTLFVNLDFYPRSAIVLSEVAPEAGYPEIPTVPRPLAQLADSLAVFAAKLEHVDVAAVAQSIAGAASSVEHLASSAKVPQAVAKLSATLGTFDDLGHHADAELQPLLAELRATVGDARSALVGLGGAAGATSRLVAPEAPLSVRLNEALGEVSRAADAVRELADFLQRNPNSLIVGKGH